MPCLLGVEEPQGILGALQIEQDPGTECDHGGNRKRHRSAQVTAIGPHQDHATISPYGSNSAAAPRLPAPPTRRGRSRTDTPSRTRKRADRTRRPTPRSTPRGRACDTTRGKDCNQYGEERHVVHNDPGEWTDSPELLTIVVTTGEEREERPWRLVMLCMWQRHVPMRRDPRTPAAIPPVEPGQEAACRVASTHHYEEKVGPIRESTNGTATRPGACSVARVGASTTSGFNPASTQHRSNPPLRMLPAGWDESDRSGRRRVLQRKHSDEPAHWPRCPCSRRYGAGHDVITGRGGPASGRWAHSSPQPSRPLVSRSRSSDPAAPLVRRHARSP